MKMYFLDASDVLEIHDDILDREPGLKGVNLEKLDAVIGRVKNIYAYSGDIVTPFDLAAHYGVAIARGHAFNDANKRTAFVTMISVLKVNNIPVPEEIGDALAQDVASWSDIMVHVAEGKIDAKQLGNNIAVLYMAGLAGIGLVKLASVLWDKFSK